MNKRPLIRFFKATGILLIALLLLLLIGFILIRQAGVQTWLANRMLERIEAETGGKATIDRVDVRFPTTLKMDGFYLEDVNGDTLLYAGSLFANVEMLKLKKRILHIGKIRLDDARIFLNTTPGASTLPEFLSKKKEKVSPSGKMRPYLVDFETLEVNRAHFEWRNDSAVSIIPASFEKLSASVETMDLAGRKLFFSSVALTGPQIRMSGTGKEKTDKGPMVRLAPDLGWEIGIGELEMSDGQVWRTTDGVTAIAPSSLPDITHLHLSELAVKATDFRMDSLLTVQIESITGRAGDLVALKEGKGGLTLTERGFEADDLSIRVNDSKLSLDSRGNISDFSRFILSLRQETSISATLAPSDLALFLPAGKNIKNPVYLEARGTGTLGDFNISYLKASSQGGTLNASGNITGLPEVGNMKYRLKINRLTASAKSVRQMVPWIEIPEIANTLGKLSASGTVSGDLQRIATHLKVNTEAGNFTAATELASRNGQLKYNGTIDADGFDLGKILPDVPVGTLYGKVKLVGEGADLNVLKADLSGDLERFLIGDYEYRNIQFAGTLEERIFKGSMEVGDDCLAMQFKGTVDLSDSIPAIDSWMHIEEADLQSLGFMKKKLVVSLDGNINLTGSKPDNVNGSMHLNDLRLVNDHSEVTFDTTLLTISNRDGYTQYNLINQDLIASVSGYFDPLILPGEIKRSLSQHIHFVNSTDSIPWQKQQIQGSISLAEGFGLTKFLVGNVELPDNLEADFIFDNSRDLIRLNAHSNFVGYKKFGIDTFSFKLNTRDDAMMLTANIAALNVVGSTFKIEDIGLRTTSTKDHITWNLEVEDPASPNRIVLAPELEFVNDSIVVHFIDSYLRLNDMDWLFNERNELIFKEEVVIAKNFSIHNNDQYIEIINASSDLSDVSLEFSRLDIPALANIAKLDTILQAGYLSGIIRVHDPLGEINADIGLMFDSIQVFDYYCNQLSIDAFYDKVTNDIQLAADFMDPNYDLTAIGSYDLTPGVRSPIDLSIDVRSLELSFLDKILKHKAEIRAHGRGDLFFRGSFKEPVLLGAATVNDTGRVHIDFLGIDFLLIEEDVTFTENNINFQSVNVFDPFGNQAYLEGKLTHFNFKDMSISATLATDNFNVLNTTSFDNEEFYGTAFGDGFVTFTGLTRNINMEIDMKTNPGTRVSIPVSQAGDTKQYDDIIFINPVDSLKPGKTEEKIEIKGVNLDFQLEVTPDAELEIVLNTESDNNLTAHGQGDLDLRIDQNKQLSIYGRYDIRDGKYVFSPQNLLNKRFDIQNGSYINWTGKPFEAELYVNALYNVNARVDNILEDSTQAYQTVPMDVVINIGGTLDQTDVSFDIQTQQTGLTRVPDEVTIFLNDIKDDQGEVTTQAIALLIVNRFLPSNTTVFTGTSLSAGDFGKTTAFELISNQVSNYLTDAISKLITEAELNFNFTQRENNSIEEPGQTTEFQVDFKTSFVQNRLIVKVGGNFEVNDAQNSEQNTIAGDFEVEGLLTKDGRLRGKAYHRTADYDIFNQDRSKTGVGISYQKDFDNISEVFTPDPFKSQRRKDKRRDRRDRKEDERNQKAKLKAVNPTDE